MTGPFALTLTDLPLALGVSPAGVGAVLVASRRRAGPPNDDSETIHAIAAAITSAHGLVPGMTLEGERTDGPSPRRGGRRTIGNAQALGLAPPAPVAISEAMP